jgi:seryl-tRNA synthetase
MLGIEVIRKNPEWVKEQLQKLNDTAPIDEILEEDSRRRAIIQAVEVLRQNRNTASKNIGRPDGKPKEARKDP